MANKPIYENGVVVGVDLASGDDETVTLSLCDLRGVVRSEVKAAVDEVLQAILARAADSTPTIPAPATDEFADVSDEELNELMASTGYRLKGTS